VTGFVRAERIVQGQRFENEFYCGRCDYRWTIVDGEQPTVSHPKQGGERRGFADRRRQARPRKDRRGR
jgi:hypothetical protein